MWRHNAPQPVAAVTKVAMTYLLLQAALGNAAGVRGERETRPNYHWVVCEISDTCGSPLDDYCKGSQFCNGQGDDSHSYYFFSRGRAGQESCGEPCEAVEGMKLEVRCQYDTQTLFLNGTAVAGDGLNGTAVAGDGLTPHDNETASGVNGVSVSWAFATLESAAGKYECRWANGSSFGNRSVVIHTHSYLVPFSMASSDADQSMGEVAGQFCYTAYKAHEIHSSLERHCVYFHVLGKRPISLSIDPLWPNHYPVNLDLQWPSTANTGTSLHNVSFSSERVAIVSTANPVNIYLRITASNTVGSTSTCFLNKLEGSPVIFINDSLPSDQTVVEGQPAELLCPVQSDEPSDNSPFPSRFSASLLLQLPSQPSPALCFSCTFSHRDISCETIANQHQLTPCSGIHFSSRSSGLEGSRTHLLVVRWPLVQISDNNSIVICAITEMVSVTQWAHSATLTVLPPTPSPNQNQTKHQNLATLALSSGLVAVVVVVMVMVVVMVVVGVCCCVFWRGRKNRHVPPTTSQPAEEVHLTSDELCSSGLPSPLDMDLGERETPLFLLPPYSLTALHTESASHAWTNGLDSGLGPELSNGLGAVAESGEGGKPASQVCVYISYTGSQEEWVCGTLLPLLDRFRVVTVEAEGAMIAGNIVSEERLRLLQSADKMIAVVSPDYLHVEWCNYELQHAIRLRPGAAGWLVPLLCDGCSHLPSTISTLHPICTSDQFWPAKLQAALCRHPHR